jgi:hypothetical protein
MDCTAKIRMNVGVILGTEIIDADGNETATVLKDAALRVHGTNIGVISFKATMSTKVIGKAVTKLRDAPRWYDEESDEWEDELLLPASPGGKISDESLTKLRVIEAGRTVGFRTIGKLSMLDADLSHRSPGEYVSDPLDVFAVTG